MARKPSKTTVNAENLAGLGAERLAELLMEVAEGRADVKRRLKLALTGEIGAEELAAQIAKRIATFAKAQAWIHWRKRSAFFEDLELQRRTLAERLAPMDAPRALDLLWRLRALRPGLWNRMGEAAAKADDIFDQADRDIARLASAPGVAPMVLADEAYDALARDEKAVGLIVGLHAALGPVGVKALTERLRSAIGAGHDAGLAFAEALRGLADLEGDADAWIATITPKQVGHPYWGAAIAERLLKAGRAEEALGALERASPDLRPASWPLDPQHRRQWDAAWWATLDALGRTEEAQALRWQAFERDLSPKVLRDYLSRLPEFDDVEAEDRAKAHAAQAQPFRRALAFFLAWQDWLGAAELILARRDEVPGDDYELLGKAAARLEARQPLAATLLRRAMILNTLNRTLSLRYAQAALQLADNAALAPLITNWRDVEPQDSFLEWLLARYRRLPAFAREYAARNG
jgi:hypothetical protein